MSGLLKLLVLGGLSASVMVTSGCSSDSKADTPVASSAPPPTSGELPAEAQFYSLHSGAPMSSSSKSQKLIKVIETQQDYVATLTEYSSDAPKVVDFSKGRVLVLARGWASTPGNGIGVVTVNVSATYVVANIELINSGCTQAQVITYPYQFVFVPTTKTILFSEKIVNYPCL